MDKKLTSIAESSYRISLTFCCAAFSSGFQSYFCISQVSKAKQDTRGEVKKKKKRAENNFPT